MGFELVTCPICGKGFIPSPDHQLTNGHGKYVCSPSCSTAAWKRNNKRKLEAEERAIAKAKERTRVKNERQNLKMQKADNVVGKVGQCAKTVYMYETITGKFVKSFPSCTATAQEVHLHPTTVSQICRGRQKSSIEYTFRYEKRENVKDCGESKPHTNKKAVVQLTQDGEIIERFPSMLEATRKTGISVSSIHDCCYGRYKTSKGFKFMLESEYNKKKGINDEN